ncbi:hypothetical protein PUN4_100148 [Paraburkholderia unamae]|nr:hypothetical protein PUN4_100148 [Paraburkholderia unamae]
MNGYLADSSEPPHRFRLFFTGFLAGAQFVTKDALMRPFNKYFLVQIPALLTEHIPR